MGTWDITIQTACCDVEPCEAIYGDEDDWSVGWWEFANDAEDEAIRGTWTRVDGLLICESQDEAHQAARHIEPDHRPKPGPGQLTLIPHWTQRTKWIST